MQVGNALQGTLLAVRVGLEGFSTSSIGMLTSGFYAGMCTGSVIAGRLIAQAGHIRTFAALASLGSAAALVHLLLIHPAAWILVRTLTGACFAGLIIVVEFGSTPPPRPRTADGCCRSTRSPRWGSASAASCCSPRPIRDNSPSSSPS